MNKIQYVLFLIFRNIKESLYAWFIEIPISINYTIRFFNSAGRYLWQLSLYKTENKFTCWINNSSCGIAALAVILSFRTQDFFCYLPTREKHANSNYTWSGIKWRIQKKAQVPSLKNQDALYFPIWNLKLKECGDLSRFQYRMYCKCWL